MVVPSEVLCNVRRVSSVMENVANVLQMSEIIRRVRVGSGGEYIDGRSHSSRQIETRWYSKKIAV